MLKKKKWVIASILAAVIVVAVGILGVAAYADSNTTTTAKTTPVDQQKVLADKVATILGLDASKVEAAFTQAQTEINAERAATNLKAQEARIDQLVTDGKLTADEAAKYKTWLESKPNVEVPGIDQNSNFGPGNGGSGGFNRGMPRDGASSDSTVAPTATTTN